MNKEKINFVIVMVYELISLRMPINFFFISVVIVGTLSNIALLSIKGKCPALSFAYFRRATVARTRVLFNYIVRSCKNLYLTFFKICFSQSP